MRILDDKNIGTSLREKTNPIDVKITATAHSNITFDEDRVNGTIVIDKFKKSSKKYMTMLIYKWYIHHLVEIQ